MVSLRDFATHESFVFDLKRSALRSALAAGHNVVLDDTHLNVKHLRTVHKWLAEIGDVTVFEQPFNVSMDECNQQ